MDTLEVLDGTGHITIAWDASDPDQVAKARAEIARLKAAGYSFFLVAGEPADEIAAGRGELIVQRIDDPTALPAPPANAEQPSADQPSEEQPPAAGRRGRRTVATRPMRGGADEGPVTLGVVS